MTGRFGTYRMRWKRKTAQYGGLYGELFFAKARIGPGSNPEKVDHLYSAALHTSGERFYMFKSERDRERFLSQCPGASVCQDPVSFLPPGDTLPGKGGISG